MASFYMIGSEAHTFTGMEKHIKQKLFITRKYCTLTYSTVVNYSHLIALRKDMPSVAD